uniref:Curli production assembly/transport component CsgF n=1 Tax=Haemonchus contortus TaxID=6289 RepID=A0A7I4YJV7_HAECO
MKTLLILSLTILSLSTDAQFVGLSVGFDSLLPTPLFPTLPVFPTFPTAQFVEWENAINKRMREIFRNSSLSNGGITTSNGTTTITQKIGGKLYKGTLPETKSFFLSTSVADINGTRQEIVKIVADGKTSVYSTIDGKTTATDGDGKPLTDGGFFKINMAIEPGSREESNSEKGEKELKPKLRKVPKKPIEDH